MLHFFRLNDRNVACNFLQQGWKTKNGAVTKKVEKTTQNLLTEQGPYNIITQCDVVRNA